MTYQILQGDVLDQLATRMTTYANLYRAHMDYSVKCGKATGMRDPRETAAIEREAHRRAVNRVLGGISDAAKREIERVVVT